MLLLGAAGFLYYRRAATLASRGAPVERWRRLVFGLGLLLAFTAVASPIHAFGEEQFFAAHMTQHILLGDLAPLCMVAGLTGPILRPVLALPVVMRLRFLTLPYVAFPIWAANLLLWHLPVAYQGEEGNTPTVTRRLVQITVSVEILDQHAGKPLWQRSGLLLEGDYPPGREIEGRTKALDKLITNIVEGAQSQW